MKEPKTIVIIFILLLFLAVQCLLPFLYGWVWYLYLSTFFANLMLIYKWLGWEKKYSLIYRLIRLCSLTFGLSILAVVWQDWRKGRAPKKIADLSLKIGVLVWSLLICSQVPWWVAAVHFPLLIFSYACYSNLYIYYIFAYKPTIEFYGWFSDASAQRQKDFIRVGQDLLKSKDKTNEHLLVHFAVNYTAQYPLPTQYSPQTQALEDFIWEFLAQPNLPTLPKPTVISLLARQVGLSDLHQKLPTAAAREAVSIKIKQRRGILKSEYTMILSPKMIAHIRKIDDLFVDLNKSNYHAYLPPLIIKMLVLDEIWMRSLAAHHSNSPVVKELFVYIIEEWGNIATDFFNRPKLYPDYDWFFNRLSLSQLIETYTNDLLPLFEKDPELAEKFTYTCNMSLLGSEIAKNLH